MSYYKPSEASEVSSKNNQLVMGIDTSNYTTSIAIVSKKDVLFDRRKLLTVKEGVCGLRQSEAFFQHVQALPTMIEEAMNSFNGSLSAIACATRPRSVENSYMPVFNAGSSIGKTIAATLKIPFFSFSHQEGHIAAIGIDLSSLNNEEIQVFHISGGTCELLSVFNKKINIIGGSKDISFGQLLDRVATSLRIPFPGGATLDNLAYEELKKKKGEITLGRSSIISPIKTNNNTFNLSGIESQCQRSLSNGVDKTEIIEGIFREIAKTIIKVSDSKKTYLVGGVSSSRTLRYLLAKHSYIVFPETSMGSDNGVGIGKLGVSQLPRQEI